MNKLIKDILKRIEEQQSDLSFNIASNGCSNMNEYGFRCGIVTGLLEVRSIIEEEYENYTKREGLEDDGTSF